MVFATDCSLARTVPYYPSHQGARPELPVITLNMICISSKFHHTSIVKASIEQCTPCAERARRSQTRVRFWVWLHHTLKQSMPYMRELWRLHWPNPILIYRWRKLSVWYVRIIHIHALFVHNAITVKDGVLHYTPAWGTNAIHLLKLLFKTSIITGMV